MIDIIIIICLTLLTSLGMLLSPEHSKEILLVIASGFFGYMKGHIDGKKVKES